MEKEAFHDGGGLESYAVDLFLWVWTLSLCADEFYKYAQAPLSFYPDLWNMYDYITFFVVQASLFLRFLSIRGSVEGAAVHRQRPASDLPRLDPILLVAQLVGTLLGGAETALLCRDLLRIIFLRTGRRRRRTPRRRLERAEVNPLVTTA